MRGNQHTGRGPWVAGFCGHKWHENDNVNKASCKRGTQCSVGVQRQGRGQRMEREAQAG